MENKGVILKEILKEHLKQLQESVVGLEDVFEHCKKKSLAENFSPRELESFDALAIRFSRTTDVFTQKVLRCVLLLLREEEKTFLDRARLVEKIGLISSAEKLILIRDLRNSIVHEYVLENWSEIFKQIMNYTPLLLGDIALTKQFAKNKFGT